VNYLFTRTPCNSKAFELIAKNSVIGFETSAIRQNAILHLAKVLSADKKEVFYPPQASKISRLQKGEWNLLFVPNGDLRK